MPLCWQFCGTAAVSPLLIKHAFPTTGYNPARTKLTALTGCAARSVPLLFHAACPRYFCGIFLVEKPSQSVRSLSLRTWFGCCRSHSTTSCTLATMSVITFLTPTPSIAHGNHRLCDSNFISRSRFVMMRFSPPWPSDTTLSDGSTRAARVRRGFFVVQVLRPGSRVHDDPFFLRRLPAGHVSRQRQRLVRGVLSMQGRQVFHHLERIRVRQLPRWEKSRRSGDGRRIPR